MIHIVKNKIFPSNTYLVSDKYGKECLLIDPGLDEKLIDDKLIEQRITPIGILSTHGHFDHIGSASFFQKKYEIPFYLHEKDYKLSQSVNFYLKIAGIDHKVVTPKPDLLIKSKYERITIKNFQFEVYNFPGHSDGGIIIKYEDSLFSGDLIYKKGLGFNNFPGENKSILRQSIYEVFEKFSNESNIYPGHGESETLGNIKKNNLKLLDFLNKK